MVIEIQSLATGHTALLGAVGNGPHQVFVSRIRVRDAGALGELLQGTRWSFHSWASLMRLFRADDVLQIMEKTVIPALIDLPVDGTWVDELYRMEAKLESHGGTVGGSFNRSAKKLSKRAKDLATLRNNKRSHQARSARAEDLLRRVIDLRDTEVTIG